MVIAFNQVGSSSHAHPFRLDHRLKERSVSYAQRARNPNAHLRNSGCIVPQN